LNSKLAGQFKVAEAVLDARAVGVEMPVKLI
jgi:hypothetical protein